MNTYLEMVMEDVVNYFENWSDWEEKIDDFEDLESFADAIADDLWIEDGVTGNASGSYYCNSYKAKEAVFSNMEEVSAALRDFYCGNADEVAEMFLDEQWETIDVIVRCYYLREAVDEAIRECGIDETFEEREIA